MGYPGKHGGGPLMPQVPASRGEVLGQLCGYGKGSGLVAFREVKLSWECVFDQGYTKAPIFASCGGLKIS